MRYHGLFICLVILALNAFQALSQNDDYLNPSNPAQNAAASEDIKGAMQSDLFDYTGHPTSTIGSNVASNKPVILQSGSEPQPSSRPSGTITSIVIPMVSGFWDFQIIDSAKKTAHLAIYQSRDLIFGKGSLYYANSTQELTASGSASGNKLVLDLISVTNITLYKMSLDLNNRSFYGSYNAYSPGQMPWTGKVSGAISG